MCSGYWFRISTVSASLTGSSNFKLQVLHRSVCASVSERRVLLGLCLVLQGCNFSRGHRVGGTHELGGVLNLTKDATSVTVNMHDPSQVGG